MLLRLRPLYLLVALFAVAPLSGCGQQVANLVTGETTRGAYSWQEEVQIGREADGQIIAQFGLYDDDALQAYVTRIGQEVLQTSAYTDASTPAEIRNTPFYFRLLDSEVVNAFALPGGYTYVTRGLLSHLENEAQLAVVLGHEIGHVLARHSSQRAADAQLGQLGLLGAAIGSAVLGAGAGVTQGILEYGGTGVQLLFLKYGRDAEREADRAGVAYAEFAGYDAAEAARFFRSLDRLSAQSGSIPSFLSTHPDPGEREQTIPQLAAQYDTGTAVNAPQYLQQIDGIVLGTNPRQGFTENGRFYHPDLRFRVRLPQRLAGRERRGGGPDRRAQREGRHAVHLFERVVAPGGRAGVRGAAGLPGLGPAERERQRQPGLRRRREREHAAGRARRDGLLHRVRRAGLPVHRLHGREQLRHLPRRVPVHVPQLRPPHELGVSEPPACPPRRGAGQRYGPVPDLPRRPADALRDGRERPRDHERGPARRAHPGRHRAQAAAELNASGVALGVKPRLYLETSIISYLTARPSRDLVTAGRQEVTRTWWEHERVHYDLFTSVYVTEEVGRGDAEAARLRLAVLAGIADVALPPEAQALAGALVEPGPIPAKAALDAFHIAASVAGGADYLLTWNFKHLANAALRKRIEAACRSRGYDPPVICTPEELGLP